MIIISFKKSFTGGLAAASQVAVIMDLSAMIKENFFGFCGCT
jgi:hypothetical protein